MQSDLIEEESLKKIQQDIDNLYKDATKFRYRHHLLQITMLVGGVITPVTLNIAMVPKVIPTVLSIIVGVSAALAGYFKYSERSYVFFRIATDLDMQCVKYRLKRKPYDRLENENAFALLMENTNSLLFERLYQGIYPEKLSHKREIE